MQYYKDMIRKIITTLLLLTPFVTFIAIDILNADKIYPRVAIGNIDVGGTDLQEFTKIMTKELNSRIRKTITIEIPSHEVKGIKLDPDIIRPDITSMYNEAYRIGREKFFASIIWEKIYVLMFGTRLQPIYLVDDLTLDTILADELRAYEREVINTQIKFENGKLFSTLSKPGLQANREELTQQIKDYLTFKSENTSLKATFKKVEPTFTKENTQKALLDTEIALSRPLTIISQDNTPYQKTLNAPEIFQILQYTYNEEKQQVEVNVANFKLTQILNDIPQALNTPTTEGKSEIIAGVLIITEPPRPGFVVDSEKLTNDVTLALFDPGRPKTVPIPIKTIEPALTKAAVNDYGITSLLASGTSYYKGSSPQRLHNIKLATQKLHGALIPPNQTFSMYRQIGDIERTTGFTDSAIIKNGRAIIGIGGGVCQVSTTLYRSALLAGLPIVERRPHSFRVSYYEQESSPGLDAAIYFPQWDLKFTNDTPKHILIQAIIDEANEKLTINFWGHSDGRQVTLSEPTITDQRQPPKEVRIPTSTLPKGTIRQTDFATDGAKVTITRTVTRNGNDQKEDIVSVYKPWQSVYLIGTGN